MIYINRKTGNALWGAFIGVVVTIFAMDWLGFTPSDALVLLSAGVGAVIGSGALRRWF